MTSLLFSSCVSSISPGEISDLPASKGAYFGSIIYDPWKYLGSKGEDDYYRYSWHVNNFVKSKKFIITPKVDINVNHDYTDGDELAVEPIYEGGSVIGFRRVLGRFERLRDRPKFVD